MNIFFKKIAVAGFVAYLSTTAHSANLAAEHCEIFIKKVFSAPGSHNMGSFGAVIKTGWIGNGEFIEDVKFYGYAESTDLGNPDVCHWGPSYGGRGWEFLGSQPDSFYAKEWGEYHFSFPVRSGSVVTQCPGYHYTWIGTFFVQTNKNTYWLNPGLDANHLFYFDMNAFEVITRKGGTFNPLLTNREDLAYYNPLGCQ